MNQNRLCKKQPPPQNGVNSMETMICKPSLDYIEVSNLELLLELVIIDLKDKAIHTQDEVYIKHCLKNMAHFSSILNKIRGCEMFTEECPEVSDNMTKEQALQTIKRYVENPYSINPIELQRILISSGLSVEDSCTLVYKMF